MNILFSCDEKYAKYLCVSLYTIMKYNKNREISFYIFDLGISEKTKNILSSISGKNNIEFISIDISDFDSLPKTINYISKATYARLKMANYLPSHIDKIIYLDVDILVQDSLSELWNIELNECYIGACIDSFIEFSQSGYKRKIGLKNREYYFNAGVLLVNLEKWRKINIFSLCEEWLLEYKNIILYQDQDILNGIFKNQVKYIDSRFNFTPELMKRIRKGRTLHSLELNYKPVIIFHYCGENKAWHKKCKDIKCRLFLSNALEIKNISLDSFEKVSPWIKLKRVYRDFGINLMYKI